MKYISHVWGITTYLVCQSTDWFLAFLLCPLTLTTPSSPPRSGRLQRTSRTSGTDDSPPIKKDPLRLERLNIRLTDSSCPISLVRQWYRIPDPSCFLPKWSCACPTVSFLSVESPHFLAQGRTLRVNDKVPRSFWLRSVLVGEMP